MSNVQGMDGLIRRLEAIGEPKPVLRALQLATIHEAQARVHRQTGFLQRNIKPGALTETHAIVKADTPYAAAEEKGRRAVTIVPKSARVLAWGGSRRLSGRLRSGSAPTHFAMKVEQPARKGHPYLVPGAQAAAGKMKDVIITLWNGAA